MSYWRELLPEAGRGACKRHLHPSASIASTSSDVHSSPVPGRMIVLRSRGASAPRRPPPSGSSGQPTKADRSVVPWPIHTDVTVCRHSYELVPVPKCSNSIKSCLVFSTAAPAVWPTSEPATSLSAARAALGSTAHWLHPAKKQEAAMATVPAALALSAAARSAPPKRRWKSACIQGWLPLKRIESCKIAGPSRAALYELTNVALQRQLSHTNAPVEQL